MKSLLKIQNIYYALRVAAAMCFIGHGAFGIITKEIWCNYFAVFGIGHDLAYRLMPILGSVDILMGLSLLIYPIRAVAFWLVIWGVITASLRPLSGEPFAELIERAGNFGAPLALLLLCGTENGFASWFKKITTPEIVLDNQLKNVRLCMRIVVFLLLTGHGWLNLIGKKGLMGQYTSLGFHDAHQVGMISGLIEIAAAVVILLRPSRPFVLLFLVWKVGTELYYPHWELFEWIERGGSYGTLLALWFTLESNPSTKKITGWAFNTFTTGIAFVCMSYFAISYLHLKTTNDVSRIVPESVDRRSLNEVWALDNQNRHATFVFVNQDFARMVTHNRVIELQPISDDLCIDFTKYVHRGHDGPLYIILPDKYAGPKEKFILKSFPDYKGWYGSMLDSRYVIYAAK